MESAQERKSRKKRDQGRLFVFSGPSGAGKSTIINTLLKTRPDLSYSISFTTRPPRGNEKDGVEYFFVSEPVFREMIEAGDFIEWARVHDCYYGTSASFIERMTTSGRDVLLDIDVQGAKKFLARYEDAVSIFIAPPDLETLKQRLIQRATDGPEAIDKRLQNAMGELSETGGYGYVLVNKDLEETISELEQIMEKRP